MTTHRIQKEEEVVNAKGNLDEKWEEKEGRAKLDRLKGERKSQTL